MSQQSVVFRLVAEHGLELLVELNLDAGRQDFRGEAISVIRRRPMFSGGDEVDSIGIDLDHLRAVRIQPVDHFFEQVPANLCDSGRSFEISEMSLRETKVAVKAVDQDFERVLERVKILLTLRDRPPLRACSPSIRAESAEVGEQVPENLQLIGNRKTIELKHD